MCRLCSTSSIRAKAIDQQVRDTTVTPKRGTIYDRNMKTLAVSASAETVYIAPKSIKDDEEAALIARELSRILGVSEESILKKTQADNYYEVIKRQVEKETADQVREFKQEYDLASVAAGGRLQALLPLRRLRLPHHRLYQCRRRGHRGP